MERRKALFSLTFGALAIGTLGLGGCASSPPAPAARTPRSPAAPRAAFESLDQLIATDADPRRNELVMVAISHLGVPYAFGGTTPERGFDCSGLVTYVYRQALSLTLPRTAHEQGRAGAAIAVPQLRPGDLVFYNTLARSFSHVGIYIGTGRFIHAPATGGVVSIEPLFGDYWTQRFDGARRVLAG